MSDHSSLAPPRFVFGPIPSRRLGRSLGIDVIPRKLCTLDCVYCEVGRTDKRAMRRREYLPASAILSEIKDALRRYDGLDFITFSGSGEPTLNSALGQMIRGVKTMTDIPVAVITNGTLLFLEEVRQDLLEADVVLPSLDAGTVGTFETVNRPHPKLRHWTIVEGMKIFRREYSGQIWLEILFVEGMNDKDEELYHLKHLVDEITPDRIQLNTVARPPCESFALPVDIRTLRRIREYFGDRCEIIGEADGGERARDRGSENAALLALLRRRAMTIGELSLALECTQQDVMRSLATLQSQEVVESYIYRGRKFYRAIEYATDPS